MRTHIAAVLLLLLFGTANAQFEKNYTPVVSHGTLPKDFVTLSSDKYEEAKSKLSKSEKRSTRKKKEIFLLQSNFGLDQLLLGGKVLFNDPLADYVNKVATKILENDPTTRAEMRFYVLKSSAVNAFCTQQGVVFITMGMLAQLENEAQLAYTIAHEVVHYKKQHAIERYLESDKIERGKGAYAQMTMDDKLLSKCAFSKENEVEADVEGLKIFLNSQYSTGNLMGLYDVLKYAYLPFDDVDFDKAFLENTTLKLPDWWVLKETKAITTDKIEDDDERSTHPNLKSRRQTTLDAIANANNTGKSDYLVGETPFKEMREMARFELCRIYTLYHRYEEGLYTSYMLLKKYPNNLYLQKNVAFCLSGLAQYSTISEFNEVHKIWTDIEGKSGAVNFLMGKLDSIPGDLAVVAVAYIAKVKREHPKDEEITELLNTQVRSLAKKNYMGFSYFSKYAPTPTDIVDSVKAAEKAKAPDEKAASPESAGKEKSKYDKLRELENGGVKEAGVITGGRYIKYAFVEFMSEPWFREAFEVANGKADKDEALVDIDEIYTGRRRNYDKRVFSLGIKKLVIVDPYFARIDAQKKQHYKYIQSEAGQVDFTERLKTNAKAARLDCEVLNTKNLHSDEADKVNETSIMEDYISDRLKHEKDVNLPYPERARIDSIAKKYGSDYFMWTGAISLSDYNKHNIKTAVLTATLPFLLPFTLPTLVRAGQSTVYFALVYNVKTDRIEYATYREVMNRTNGYILDSHIYDVFNQIKSQKKAK